MFAIKDNVNRPKCPECGSKNAAWILWGRPIWNDNLEKKIDSKQIGLGGCVIDENSKQWKCNDCGFWFGNVSLRVINLKIRMQRENKKIPDYALAILKSCVNETDIGNSKICGCFNCQKIFVPKQISLWIDDIHDKNTAICPYCESDTVIGDGSGYEITEDFLKQMNSYWIK